MTFFKDRVHAGRQLAQIWLETTSGVRPLHHEVLCARPSSRPSPAGSSARRYHGPFKLSDARAPICSPSTLRPLRIVRLGEGRGAR